MMIGMEAGRESESYLISFAKAVKEYKRACVRSIDTCGLSVNEAEVLMCLARHEACNTARDIAEFLGISKSLICRSVDELIRREFLRVERDPCDGRVQRLFMSDEGVCVSKRFYGVSEHFFQLCLRDIPAEELAVFKRVLDHILENIRSAGKSMVSE